MSAAFERLLKDGRNVPGLAKFTGIYREVSCQQGRPDFIAIRQSGSRQDTLPQSLGFAGAEILSLLKIRSPRRLDHLMTRSQHTGDTIQKVLRSLMRLRLARRTASGSYVLGAKGRSKTIEVWAFELKLDRPKRAIFQAKQARAYADRVFIVVPPGQELNYEPLRDVLDRWGIGVASFDPLTGAFDLHRRSRKMKPLSRSHQFYALAQVGA